MFAIPINIIYIAKEILERRSGGITGINASAGDLLFLVPCTDTE